MKEKTLILFHANNTSVFFELDGNLSKFDEVYIGSYENDIENQLSALIYDAMFSYKNITLNKPTKDWTHFITCGSV